MALVAEKNEHNPNNFLESEKKGLLEEENFSAKCL